jgi:hypothetical protein
VEFILKVAFNTEADPSFEVHIPFFDQYFAARFGRFDIAFAMDHFVASNNYNLPFSMGCGSLAYLQHRESS